MSTVSVDPAARCVELLARIHSLTLEEAVAIEEKDYDAIWLLRRQREELTRKVAEACARLAVEGQAEAATRDQVVASVARIETSDRSNLMHLQQHQQELENELVRLGAGRRAVGGYRVPEGTAASYIDRRG